MSVLCSLAQILKQVPTAEMQTVYRESAYPAGLWLIPPLSTPPQRLNSKTGPSGCLTRGLEASMGGPNPSQEFTPHGTKDEQDNGCSKAG